MRDVRVLPTPTALSLVVPKWESGQEAARTVMLELDLVHVQLPKLWTILKRPRLNMKMCGTVCDHPDRPGQRMGERTLA